MMAQSVTSNCRPSCQICTMAGRSAREAKPRNDACVNNNEIVALHRTWYAAERHSSWGVHSAPYEPFLNLACNPYIAQESEFTRTFVYFIAANPLASWPFL